MYDLSKQGHGPFLYQLFGHELYRILLDANARNVDQMQIVDHNLEQMIRTHALSCVLILYIRAGVMRSIAYVLISKMTVTS